MDLKMNDLLLKYNTTLQKLYERPIMKEAIWNQRLN